MNFATPQFFYFLIIIPIYIGWLYINKNKKKAIQISVFKDLKKVKKKSFFDYLNKFEHLLIILMIVLFIFTLARPQGAHEKQDMSKKGIDIIIALDVSESMLAEDLKPNRIEAAKESIDKFIDGLESDRLGIIVFSGQAFTQSPLTFDYNILKEYLKNISTDNINKNVRGLSGTAIGDAILAGVNRFKESEDRTKVLVLLTDGDANTGVDPQIAAKKAQAENIKLYTIGIGQVGGAPLYTTDIMGRKTVARNRDGSPVMATFNETDLKKLAEIGEGQYFRAGDNESFDNVMEEINNLEKKDLEVSVSTEYTENFMPYLLLLYLVFLMYLILKGIKVVVK